MNANAKLAEEKSRNHDSETLEDAEPQTWTKEPYLELAKLSIMK